MLIPVPVLIPANAVIIPASGFLFPYLNSKADIGIITKYAISPTILDIIDINASINVTTFFLNFLVKA